MKANVLYFADNGRIICTKCAGASALITGRDLSGQPIEEVTREDAAYLEAALGRTVTCEMGCTAFSPILSEVNIVLIRRRHIEEVLG